MLKKIVGFFVNQFSERGTEIATFNYALYLIAITFHN